MSDRTEPSPDDSENHNSENHDRSTGLDSEVDAPQIAPSKLPIQPVPRAIWAPVMAVGLAGAAAVFWFHRDQPIWALCLFALVIVSAHLSAIDFHQQRLPNSIVGRLAGATTILVFLYGSIEADLGRAGRAIALGVACFFVLLLMNLLGGMGMGDVKFGYPLGVALGWYGADPLILGAMTMVLSAGVFALIVLVRTRSRNGFFAFGPFMTVGLIAGLLSAGAL